MTTHYISGLLPEASVFLQSFDYLFPPEKLTLLGLLFDRMYNGMINSENTANEFEVSDDGYILMPGELGVDSCGDIAFELVHRANDCFASSFPHSCLIDCIDTWITYTPSLDTAESYFNKLSFSNKLYALAEIFCHVGDRDIGVELDEFEFDGYMAAHMLLDLIAELYPNDQTSEDLPF